MSSSRVKSLRRSRPSLATIIMLSAGMLVGSLQAAENKGRDITFRGPVFALARDARGQIVQLTVRVNQSQIDVVVTSWTSVFVGRGFRSDRQSLRLGEFAAVSGFFTSAGRIVAQRIQLESRNDIELDATVEVVSGNQVTVGGIAFQVEASSLVRNAAGGAGSISDLAAGVPIRLRGDREGSGWVIRELEYGPRTVESEPVRFDGTIRDISGDLLGIDVGIRIAGQVISALVAVDQATRVEGALNLGRYVEVEGRFLPGTSLLRASRIAVDANFNGTTLDDMSGEGAPEEMEIEGSLGSPQMQSGGTVSAFLIGETTIVLNSATEILWRDGGAASSQDLTAGRLVHVNGLRQPDRSVLARRILIKAESNGPGNGGGGDSSEPEQLEGTITDLTRRQADETVTRIVVGETPVQVSAETIIRGPNDETLPNSALEIGLSVEVDAVRQGNGALVAESIRIREASGSGNQEGDGEDEPEPARVSGVISAIQRLNDGSIGGILVSEVAVRINANTVIEDARGEVQPSSVLAVGLEVRVEGVASANGTILATKIVIED